MSALEETHEAFDRGTEAGRLVYNLYNNAASVRKNYKPNVRIKTRKSALNPEEEHKMKMKMRSEAVKREKSHGKATYLKKAMPEREPRYAPMPVRKPRAQIEYENEQNFPRDAPTPTMVVRDTREQQILKLQNKFAGVPEIKRKGVSKHMRKEAPVPVRIDPEEARFNQLVGEIKEREDFLEEMYELGQGKRYEAQIKGEVAQMVLEMESLDKKLKSKFGR